VIRVFFVATVLGVAFSFGASAIAGETPGLNGFALCTSKAPNEIGYVKGNRVYLSAIFQVYAVNAGYEKAFAAFLRQKYHFSGPVSCPVAFAKDGAVKTLDERARTIGSLAVRTGWVYANAAVASTSTTATVRAASDNAGVAHVFFVCTWPTSSAGVLTFYVSDVNADPPDVEPGPFLGELAPAFGRFVAAKYHVEGGSFNCVYQFSQATAEALKQRYLTTAVPQGYKPVDTGWIYKASEP
jgi:hypothetical protein